MRGILTLIGIVALLLMGPAHAAELDVPSPAEARQMLLHGKFAELDQRFGAIQSAYVAGKITDESLRAAFRVFYDTDASLDVAYTNWVAHSPKSYVAHVARGIYYRFTAAERRGEESASRTTEKQFADMRAAQAVAAREFDASLKLDRKPVLTYFHYMDISSTQGNHKRVRELFDRGLSIDPKTFILRDKYIGTLVTKWGGSTAQVREFVEECRAAGLSQNQVAGLQSVLFEDEAWVLQYRVGDLDAAAAAYGRAATLNPAASCRRCDPHYRRVEIFQQQKQYAKIIKAASEFLRERPDDTRMLNMRGDAYVTLGKGPEAQADLLRSAKLGDVWAQNMYAKMLLSGYLVTANRDEAIRWLTQAAEQGDAESIEILPIARNRDAVIHFTP